MTTLIAVFLLTIGFVVLLIAATEAIYRLMKRGGASDAEVSAAVLISNIIRKKL